MEELKKNLDYLKTALSEAEKYGHACHVLTFDMETICPEEAMEEQGEVTAFLEKKAFEIKKSPEFIRAEEYVFTHMNQLKGMDLELAKTLEREYLKKKNITPEFNHQLSVLKNKAFSKWMKARRAADYELFRESLQQVVIGQIKEVALRESPLTVYNRMLDDYDRGMTTNRLDKAFDQCKEKLIPLLKEIQKSDKKIRTDFMFRTVTDSQQQEMAKWLLETMGFDFKRGAFTTTEHPFTDTMGKLDTRVTTNYDPNSFASNMYSIIHEGGHALFDMNQPAENFDYFITENKTMGQHESVSRFYENIIGRSRAFVSLIFPKMKEVFSDVLFDVTEEEFYLAINTVNPSLIRTEADEFTYTFHVIIRYEIEKAVVEGLADFDELPQLWADKYEEYLGVRPANDAEGLLQDVHWTEGFGYFPSYAIGNMYNAMYYNRMCKDFDFDEAVAKGDFAKINSWMEENVYKKADVLDSAAWIKDITGREFTADDFLAYIEEKYRKIYGI